MWKTASKKCFEQWPGITHAKAQLSTDCVLEGVEV